ncbi:glutathione S-transferase family protein [Sphingomonas sp. BN140010]|uniref:Glutathione S-transferase family protein n=1 Tax=Sphingomonas arvum TaxID=2992113 RepID=A0ABT3JHP0_9SPHN|nr:glutathione S-transferase family protein [Sphingomonas sp. BN140010]MCW3798606.1 glutathione S-transferase family protein [Sphingomonas sp. BN140010]
MMILFGSSFSPYVRKVLVVAAEKGIELEVRPVGVGDRDEQFRAASPLGKMPALADGDYRLADSSAIVHYLEAKYPSPALIPAEAKARGRTIWYEEFADTVLMGCLAKMFFNRVVAPVFLRRDGNADIADMAERDELPPLLSYLEQTVPAEGYLVGDGLTLADVAVASPLGNLPHMRCSVVAESYPRLAAYLERIHGRPSFKSYLDRELAYLAKVGALSA